MKFPAINSINRSKIVYQRNCFNNKRIFEEFAGGVEYLASPSDKVFLPRIICIKKRSLVKVG